MPDPAVFLITALAVFITGISKGGFGGIALLAVPLMSLVMPPTQAAALMLPLLLLMDAFGLFAWRQHAAWPHLKILLPGALFGVFVGLGTATYVSEDFIRLIVGVIAVCFCLWRWLSHFIQRNKATGQSPHRNGAFWGMIAGYTSYVAHAGSPPYHVYLLPKALDKQAFAATHP